MSKVVILRCDSYDYEKVRAVVIKAVDLLGGPGIFITSGEKILLKPNLLSADSPEKCVTTHPMVFRAVADVFQRAGAILSYGDSPAFQSPGSVARKTGIAEVANQMSIELADFVNGEEVSFPQAIQNKRLTIAKGVLEAEGVISIAKLKTHGFAKMTGAIKNQFGCIPGTLKGEFHVKLPDIESFANMLVDINRYIKPRLYVMDGIMAMEGNGPRGGRPFNMKIVLLSTDPVALDATVCRIVNLEPQYVPTIVAGHRAGLGTYLEDDIELLGDPLESFTSSDFNVKREPLISYKPRKTLNMLRNAIVPKPVIDTDKCIKCGICVKMCPVIPKAVNWQDDNRDKPPRHMYKNCIRCFCCQELCPESAIDLKVPIIRKILLRK
ncbi:MAG: DUF362 domain-containing protein [Peptococcaceae bacterium]|nr:DUF362 domain-containing protein [Peptococcaceae bacterium]